MTETRRFSLFDLDGSVVVKPVNDCPPPTVVASDDAWGRLRRFLHPIIPERGDMAILTSQGFRHQNTEMFGTAFLAVHEVLVPNHTALGHAELMAEASRPADIDPSVFDAVTRNIQRANSTSFDLAVQGRFPGEWLAWGRALAIRHKLRLIATVEPGARITPEFRNKALVFKSKRIVRLRDGRWISYRSLGDISCNLSDRHRAAIDEGRRQYSEAGFELSLKHVEPMLQPLSADDAETLRKGLKAIWDAGCPAANGRH